MVSKLLRGLVYGNQLQTLSNFSQTIRFSTKIWSNKFVSYRDKTIVHSYLIMYTTKYQDKVLAEDNNDLENK